jgi:predicted transcriptional regulator
MMNEKGNERLVFTTFIYTQLRTDRIKIKKQFSAIKRTRTMSSVKDRMAEIIQEQPEDATYEEIMRELAFERMVERGLADSRTGRVISNEEMARRIRS